MKLDNLDNNSSKTITTAAANLDNNSSKTTITAAAAAATTATATLKATVQYF